MLDVHFAYLLMMHGLKGDTAEKRFIQAAGRTKIRNRPRRSNPRGLGNRLGRRPGYINSTTVRRETRLVLGYLTCTKFPGDNNLGLVSEALTIVGIDAVLLHRSAGCRAYIECEVRAVKLNPPSPGFSSQQI